VLLKFCIQFDTVYANVQNDVMAEGYTTSSRIIKFGGIDKEESGAWLAEEASTSICLLLRRSFCMIAI
jgi:hypothetical protein